MLKHLGLLAYAAMNLDGGWHQLHEPVARVDVAQGHGFAVTTRLVRASGLALILAAVAVQIPLVRRVAAATIAPQLAVITLIGHPFGEEQGMMRAQQRLHFLKNLSMIGSAVYVAAHDGERYARALR